MDNEAFEQLVKSNERIASYLRSRSGSTDQPNIIVPQSHTQMLLSSQEFLAKSPSVLDTFRDLRKFQRNSLVPRLNPKLVWILDAIYSSQMNFSGPHQEKHVLSFWLHHISPDVTGVSWDAFSRRLLFFAKAFYSQIGTTTSVYLRAMENICKYSNLDLTNFTYEKFQWCVNQLGFYISFAEPYSDDDFFENYLMLATFGSGKGKDAHNSVVGTLKTKKTWKSSKNDPSRLLLATPNFDPETGLFRIALSTTGCETEYVGLKEGKFVNKGMEFKCWNDFMNLVYRDEMIKS
eukprot:CAMPEP_0201495494 /NCGR_PEP_ID=MMETSP0151_2-20130828/54287_1 /ASSEMBLY_ACC=CAM_ASM_000257 /TAXON_ID=200890 /ORGANISM="Paramoeba atlantica, Strain 621/1 / CCAP 1560/9" /LENGTH=290 /DNA_ID=CAMNT_0047884557 /DNA_START=185 /DNA_END=1054 /DNA_ORIENTATION=-